LVLRLFGKNRCFIHVIYAEKVTLESEKSCQEVLINNMNMIPAFMFQGQHFTIEENVNVWTQRSSLNSQLILLTKRYASPLYFMPTALL
jgi:hypothetical protein